MKVTGYFAKNSYLELYGESEKRNDKVDVHVQFELSVRIINYAFFFVFFSFKLNLKGKETDVVVSETNESNGTVNAVFRKKGNQIFVEG